MLKKNSIKPFIIFDYIVSIGYDVMDKLGSIFYA